MRGSQKKERYLARIMGSTQVETLAGLPTLGETNNYNPTPQQKSAQN